MPWHTFEQQSEACWQLPPVCTQLLVVPLEPVLLDDEALLLLVPVPVLLALLEPVLLLLVPMVPVLDADDDDAPEDDELPCVFPRVVPLEPLDALVALELLELPVLAVLPELEPSVVDALPLEPEAALEPESEPLASPLGAAQTPLMHAKPSAQGWLPSQAKVSVAGSTVFEPQAAKARANARTSFRFTGTSRPPPRPRAWAPLPPAASISRAPRRPRAPPRPWRPETPPWTRASCPRCRGRTRPAG